MDETALRDRILEVVCENGVDRDSALTANGMAGRIDSLKLLQLIEVLESSLHIRIPEEELTEQNFASVPVLLKMATRLSQSGARQGAM